MTGHVLRAALDYGRADVLGAQQWGQEQVRQWGVRSAFVALWLEQAAARLPAGTLGRAVLEYDPVARLLSCDVWLDGRRVYGMDDFV